MEKGLQQLYYIKMKISYDLGLIAIGVTMASNDAITFSIYLSVSLYQGFFFKNRLREFVPAIIASIMTV